jgi:hypothetical protein
LCWKKLWLQSRLAFAEAAFAKAACFPTKNNREIIKKQVPLKPQSVKHL